MVKGYASEGHDSGHMDYGGNINTRAGGEADFGTLFASTKDVNAIYGVHVNTTEAYPEANSFRSLPFTGVADGTGSTSPTTSISVTIWATAVPLIASRNCAINSP